MSEFSQEHVPTGDDIELVKSWTHGGHEVDAPMARPLFILTALLVIVTIASGIGVSQLFQANSRTMIEDSSKALDSDLVKYRATMTAATSTYSQDEKERTKYRVPVTRAMDLAIKSPSRLKAAAPPAGFIHPDDEKKK